MTLFYNGGNGVYNIEKRLAPGEQIWADVGRIIREQIPDRDGHTIPPTVTSGSSELWDLDHPGLGHVFEGKLLLDKTYGRAFYGCNICCRQYGAALHVTPFSGPVGSGDYDTVTYRECDGTEYDGTWMAYGWYSCNTSIATLPDRYLSLVGVGSTTTKANIDLVTSRCQPYTDQPQQSVTVQIPTSSRIVSTLTSGQNLACPDGQAGWYRRVRKRVTDQFGTDILADGQLLEEIVSISAVNDLGLSNPSTASTTTSGGGYFDDIYSFCSTRCPASPGETDVVQQIFDTPPASPSRYTLANVNLVYKCTGITANGQ